MEEDEREEEEEETQGGEGDVESSLLDPGPGEEDKEDEEEVEDTREEELLKEEVSTDDVKEVDKEDMKGRRKAVRKSLPLRKLGTTRTLYMKIKNQHSLSLH